MPQTHAWTRWNGTRSGWIVAWMWVALLLTALSGQAAAVERDDCLLGDGEPAIKVCRVLLRADPDDVALILALAELYKFEQRYADEVTLLEDALERRPDDKRISQLLEVARSNLDEQAFAHKLRRQDQETEVEVSLKVAAIRCRNRSGEAAVTSCDRVLKAAPDNVVALMARAEALLSLDREEAAIADIRKAAALAPDDKAIALKLALLTRSDLPQQLAMRGTDNAVAVEKTLRETIVFGRFVALVIGNNDYEYLQDLKTARGDAQAVARMLEERYGFETVLLLDATRYDILKTLSEMRKSLRTIDNFLIYYAGHGVLDEAAEQGYWLPVDAEEDIKANWISNADLTDMLRALDARHAMVVADSCFSGTLVRSGGPAVLKGGGDRAKLLTRLAEKVSRTVMTSGGVEPVLDAGGGQHSVFAKAFLDVLAENDQVLEGQKIFDRLRERVVINADQTPEYSDVRKAGHDGGDFIFIPKQNTDVAEEK